MSLSPKSIESAKSKVKAEPSHRLAALLLLVILSVSAGFIGGYFGGKTNNISMTGEVQRQTISSEGELITSTVKDVSPSVVSIEVTSEALRSTYYGNRSVQNQSAGTGVIIDSNGTIITNRHVIPKGATSVSITLSDGTRLDDVEVIGRTNDRDSLDIAFLKVKDSKGKDLKPAKLSDSSKVEVGQRVIAIGNTLGQFQNTVTAGIISGYGREVTAGDETGTDTLQNLFQTDAAISQGNSGGPLVNFDGEVIGINTAVAGSAQNVGFAIPINDVMGLINSVKKDGKLVRPFLGVRYVSLTDDIAYRYNLNVKRGAFIVPQNDGQPTIISDSPAQKAGLKEGDVIIKVNDVSVDDKNSLVSALGKHSVGDSVTLLVVRDGKEQKIEVKLEAASEN